MRLFDSELVIRCSPGECKRFADRMPVYDTSLAWPAENFKIRGLVVKNSASTQIAQGGVHPAGNAAVAGRCAASGGGLRRALQQRPSEQRGWLHHAEGHARRASAGDPRREGPEVGGGAKAAADSSAAGCVIRFGATVREAHFPSTMRRGRFNGDASSNFLSIRPHVHVVDDRSVHYPCTEPK